MEFLVCVRLIRCRDWNNLHVLVNSDLSKAAFPSFFDNTFLESKKINI